MAPSDGLIRRGLERGLSSHPDGLSATTLALVSCVLFAPLTAHADTFTSAPDPVAGVDTLLIRPTGSALSSSLAVSSDSSNLTATLTPGELWDSDYNRFWSEIRLALTSEVQSGRSRAALSWTSNPFSLRSARGRAIQASILQASILRAEGTEEDCSTVAPENKLLCDQRSKAEEWRQINSAGLREAAFTLTAAYEVYPFGHVPDNDGMLVTREGNGGVTVQATMELRPTEGQNLTGWLTYKRTQPDGEPGAMHSHNLGGGLAWSGVVRRMFRSKPAELRDYVDTGFVPGIGLGVSVQVSHCFHEADLDIGDHTHDCDQRRGTQASIALSVDLLASSSVQVRLSVPLEVYDPVQPEGDISWYLKPTLSIAGALGSP